MMLLQSGTNRSQWCLSQFLDLLPLLLLHHGPLPPNLLSLSLSVHYSDVICQSGGRWDLQPTGVEWRCNYTQGRVGWAGCLLSSCHVRLLCKYHLRPFVRCNFWSFTHTSSSSSSSSLVLKRKTNGLLTWKTLDRPYIWWSNECLVH